MNFNGPHERSAMNRMRCAPLLPLHLCEPASLRKNSLAQEIRSEIGRAGVPYFFPPSERSAFSPRARPMAR